MRRLVLAGAVMLSSPLAARDVPDYLAHIVVFEFAAKMLVSARSCEHFGIAVDDKGIVAYADRSIVQAVKDGIRVADAKALALGALRDEQERQEFVANSVNADDSDGVSGVVDYWMDRCAYLAADERSAPFFKVAGR